MLFFVHHFRSQSIRKNVHLALALVDTVGLVRILINAKYSSSNLIFFFCRFNQQGHNEPKDEWIPRLIKYLNVRVTGGAVRVFCGSTFSLVIGGHNNLLIFGKNNLREGKMYPKAVDSLCGMYESRVMVTTN